MIYVASKDSVIRPGTQTKIHFDIHMNVNYFTNHDQLAEKLRASIEKNRDRLFREDTPEPTLKAIDGRA